MPGHILKTARTFENTHGTPPDVIYINPYHYEGLCKHYPEVFSPEQNFRHTGTRLAEGVRGVRWHAFRGIYMLHATVRNTIDPVGYCLLH
jgi:hypothetical protein